MQSSHLVATEGLPPAAQRLSPLFAWVKKTKDIDGFEQMFSAVTAEKRNEDEKPFLTLMLNKDELRKRYNLNQLSAREYITSCIQEHFTLVKRIYNA